VRVLFDESLPRKLKYELPGHDVRTVTEMGWTGMKNAPLLLRAGQEFEVFVTVDQGPKHPQNLSSLTLMIIVLNAMTNSIEHLRALMPMVLQELQKASPGVVVKV
jgi:Domain of unknown function (DUF5615)